MQRDSIDLGTVKIPRLFRLYLIPTLLGMLSLCAVTATDGIFVGRGVATERLAILSAVLCGLLVTSAFVFIPTLLVSLFLDSKLPAASIAVQGFPLFSAAFIFFIFNLTAIGYFQSIEKVAPSIVFALLRGVVFLVPAFILLPMALGDVGIWLALAVSEFLTSLSIVAYYLANRNSK